MSAPFFPRWDVGCLSARRRVDIDNNLVEIAVRPMALGRQELPVFGDAHGGQDSAIIYTVIDSARRHGLDFEGYLAELLTALSGGLKTSEINERPAHMPGGSASRQRCERTRSVSQRFP